MLHREKASESLEPGKSLENEALELACNGCERRHL